MKRYLLSLAITMLLFSSCEKEEKDNPFLITKNQIGMLTDSTQVKDVKTVFATDSVITLKGDEKFNIPNGKVEIYDSEGTQLLILTPRTLNDSTSTFSNVRIVDSRFQTEKGINNLSTFKDIQDNYKISKIDNLINTLVISVNEINAAFTIDKKEIPVNLRFNMNLNVEASQIPDNAKIKHFFINWN